MLNLADIQTEVTRQFGDTSGTQITPADIARWATDAQLDIVRRTKCNESTDTVLSVKGQGAYAIPNMLDLSRVEYNGMTLRQTTRPELDTRFPNRSIPGYFQDTPIWVYADSKSNGIVVFPTPTTAGDSITVVHNRRPADLVNPTDIPEIPQQFWEDIIRRCMQRAYELDGQWQAADRMASDYTARVSLTAAEVKDKNDDSYPSVRCLPGDMGGVY